MKCDWCGKQLKVWSISATGVPGGEAHLGFCTACQKRSLRNALALGELETPRSEPGPVPA